MSEKVDLIKEVYGRNTYPRVIDTSFNELYNPISMDISMNVYPINQTLTMEVERYINLLKVDRTKSYKIVINNLKETFSKYVADWTNEVGAQKQLLQDTIDVLKEIKDQREQTRGTGTGRVAQNRGERKREKGFKFLY